MPSLPAEADFIVSAVTRARPSRCRGLPPAVRQAAGSRFQFGFARRQQRAAGLIDGVAAFMSKAPS